MLSALKALREGKNRRGYGKIDWLTFSFYLIANPDLLDAFTSSFYFKNGTTVASTDVKSAIISISLVSPTRWRNMGFTVTKDIGAPKCPNKR